MRQSDESTANEQVKRRSARRQCCLHRQLLVNSCQSVLKINGKDDLTPKENRKRTTLLTMRKQDRRGAPNTVMDNDKHTYKEPVCK